jgi:hypothetical protein
VSPSERTLRGFLLLLPTVMVFLALLAFVHTAFGWVVVALLIAVPVLRVTWLTVWWAGEGDTWFMVAGVCLLAVWLLGALVSFTLAR